MLSGSHYNFPVRATSDDYFKAAEFYSRRHENDLASLNYQRARDAVELEKREAHYRECGWSY